MSVKIALFPERMFIPVCRKYGLSIFQKKHMLFLCYKIDFCIFGGYYMEREKKKL
jgi:hypothetical protein